jgi:CheY-like chemotaxis protein
MIGRETSRHEGHGMAKHILIIDDEEHIRQVMRLTLEAAGYEAGEAADGLRGLEAFGDGSAWDAVLLDQKMPGMDGLETLRHLRERCPGARVIMVTAYASIELAVDAMKLGATDFVRKPMTPEILRNAVTAALGKPGPTAVPSGEPGGAVESQPVVSRLTLNGFRLWPAAGAPGESPGLHRCRFMVRHPDGREQEVLVEIESEAVAQIERAAHRRLPVESAFWAALAERLLNSALWNEGKIPAAGKLMIDSSRIDREVVELAAGWDRQD